MENSDYCSSGSREIKKGSVVRYMAKNPPKTYEWPTKGALCYVRHVYKEKETCTVGPMIEKSNLSGIQNVTVLLKDVELVSNGAIFSAKDTKSTDTEEKPCIARSTPGEVKFKTAQKAVKTSAVPNPVVSEPKEPQNATDEATRAQSGTYCGVTVGSIPDVVVQWPYKDDETPYKIGEKIWFDGTENFHCGVFIGVDVFKDEPIVFVKYGRSFRKFAFDHLYSKPKKVPIKDRIKALESQLSEAQQKELRAILKAKKIMEE